MCMARGSMRACTRTPCACSGMCVVTLMSHNKLLAYAPLIYFNAVSRIALVKPDKARGVENMILAAAQRGQLGEKVRPPAGRRRPAGIGGLTSPCPPF